MSASRNLTPGYAAVVDPAALIDRSLLTHPRYGEYAQNAIARFGELQNFVVQLKTLP